MWGKCDKCETTTELDCYYNDDTGEEYYLCESCGERINEDTPDYD